MKQYIYTYWSNKTKRHEEKLAEIVASSLTEADKIFMKQTGINPEKTTNVSVSWERT